MVLVLECEFKIMSRHVSKTALVDNLVVKHSQQRWMQRAYSMKKQDVAQRTNDGFEIPTPKRGDFFGNLKKVATPEKSSVRRPAKKR